MQTATQILLCTLLLTGVVVAQDAPPFEGKHRERLEQLRQIKLIEALELDEERAVRLTVREKDFREQQKELRDRREKMVEEIRTLVDTDANDAALRAQLGKLADLDAQLVRQRHEFLLSLGDFLTIRQIATIVLFEQKFAREVRRLLEKSRRSPRR